MIDECKRHGIEPPTFVEQQGFVIVTFKAEIVRAPESGQVTPQVTPQVIAVLTAASEAERSRSELQDVAKIADREHFRKTYVETLLEAGWLERTVPDKPTSRLQRYRTTKTGIAVLERHQANPAQKK